MQELFIIDQYTLFNMTRVIAKTIPDKAIIPAHEFIRIQSGDEGMIEISATNAENNTSVIVTDVIYEQPFDIAIECSFLKPLKKQEVPLTFSLEGNRCVITCINSRWEVPIMDPNHLPSMRFTWEPLLEIQSDQLKDALETVTPFAYSENSASISNIHFKSTEDYLSVGASNHFSCATYTFDMQVPREVSFMITKDTADLITSIADEGLVYVYTGEDRALKFQTSWGGVSSVGHTFENNPINNYHELVKRYVEREHDSIKIVDKAYLKTQIQKAIAFSPPDKRMLMVDILDSKLHMQVEDYMIGRKSEQEVDIILNRQGTATKFIVAFDHMMRVISNTPSLGFDIEIPISNGSNMNCIKEPLVIQDSGFVFLVLPITT